MATQVRAEAPAIWSVQETHKALTDGRVVLIDIRSRGEWAESGVARKALPISMHEKGFSERLYAAKEMAGDRPIALICVKPGSRPGRQNSPQPLFGLPFR